MRSECDSEAVSNLFVVGHVQKPLLDSPTSLESPAPGLHALRRLLWGIPADSSKQSAQALSAADRLRARRGRPLVLPLPSVLIASKTSPAIEPHTSRKQQVTYSFIQPDMKPGIFPVNPDVLIRRQQRLLKHRSPNLIKEPPPKIEGEPNNFTLPKKESDPCVSQLAAEAPLGVIRDWLESYSREEKGFDSLTVFLETRLREALVQTGHGGMQIPNRARAAMCCDLLLKVPRLFGRFAPLVTHLVNEVLRCVYEDYAFIGNSLNGRAQVDAQHLFREPAFFDIAEAMRRKAARLQEELGELTEGAGLVKIFRDRFLLWNSRNLLLRSIMFRGWLQHSRMLARGRHRLQRLRLQYWFDRVWEGIERDREEREAFEKFMSSSTRITSTKIITDRRKSWTTRRTSAMFSDAKEDPVMPLHDMTQEADLALNFLGLASNRANLLCAITAATTVKKGKLTAKNVLECLVKLMDEAGVQISHETALNKSFVTKIGLFPAYGEVDGPFEDFLDGNIKHLQFLSFGNEVDRGPQAAFLAIQQWVEAQKPPFPTYDHLQWLQVKFGMHSDGTMLNCAAEAQSSDHQGEVIEKPLGLYTDKATQCDDSTPLDSTKTAKAGSSKTKTRHWRQGHWRQGRGGGFGVEGEDYLGTRRGRTGGAFDDDAFGVDGVRRGEKDTRDREATSSVAISSVCQLIPLLYDRLVDICNGSIDEAYKVRVQELGKHALIRRFGIKSIAINYFNGLMRTVRLCTHRELRLKLFCAIFSIEPEKRMEISTGRKRVSRSASTSVREPLTNDLEQKSSKDEELEQRRRSAGVIAIFCGIWHNYFNSLQVIEATKMQQARLDSRRRLREKSRVSRLSKHVVNSVQMCGIPSFRPYEQFLRSEASSKILPMPEEIILTLRKIPEFGGCRKEDLGKLVSRMETFSFPGDQVMLRQGDSTSPASLVVALQGSASMYIRTGGQATLGNLSKDELGQPVKRLEAPFVVGEGRMLTGSPANATIFANKCGIDAVILRLSAWDELMDENNTALRGLEVNAVQRAEERTKASGLSVNSEKISIYRSFFTDVDVNRTGRVNLSELLEAIQSKGTSVSMRDVERAFKAADKDGDLELEFDEFITMCDNLLRRGKRLFEQKRVSDVLVDTSRSVLLLESFNVAIDRTFKHTASHEPHTYAELQRRIANLNKERIDLSMFMQPSLSDKTKGAIMKKKCVTDTRKKNTTLDDDNTVVGVRGASQPLGIRSKKQTGPGVVVIDADEALSVAMGFWEVEIKAQGKLAQIMSARNVIGSLVSRWLTKARQRAIDRQAWHNFLHSHSDPGQLRRILVGSVNYEDFVDLIEEAYGLPISDTLSTTLFSDFEDFADRFAMASDEAIDASRIHLVKQVAALRTQLWYLRLHSFPIGSFELKVNIKRRSRMIILLYILKSHIEGEFRLANCDMETNTKIAELLLSARTFKVNADAAFCALRAHGIRVGRHQKALDASPQPET